MYIYINKSYGKGTVNSACYDNVYRLLSVSQVDEGGEQGIVLDHRWPMDNFRKGFGLI